MSFWYAFRVALGFLLTSPSFHSVATFGTDHTNITKILIGKFEHFDILNGYSHTKQLELEYTIYIISKQ